MTKKKKAAGRFYIGDWRVDGNLRVRDYFAAMIAQGLVANPGFNSDAQDMATAAVDMAEALLAELQSVGRYRTMPEALEDQPLT